MTNRYLKLTENIHTPAGLNDRVLFAARREAASAEAPVPAKRRRKNVFLRMGLCAACALALVLGSFTLRPAPSSGAAGGIGDGEPGTGTSSAAQILVPSFGLTAYAAGAGISYGPTESGSIGFAAGEGCLTPEFGDFTGCLFKVTGENIAKVSFSIDRGGLYRYQSRDNLTDEQMNAYRQAMAEGSLAPAAISQKDDGTWYMPEMTALGNRVEEDYDPEAWYGFWVSPEEAVINTGLGISIEAQMDADLFDGGLLTVTVTSSDGTEKTQNYRLHSGSLKVEFAEDNTITVLPELAGPDDLYVYGIYATPED